MNTAAAMQTPMPMMGGMMPGMMPMMGGMMPMPMMMKMSREMGADGMMTCRMMPMDGMPMETYTACRERMMTMVQQGMPCMMCCGGLIMICMPMMG